MTSMAPPNPLSRWDRFYDRLARPRVFLAFGVLYLLSQALILVILHRLGPDALTLQTTFSPQTFLAILGNWGQWGLDVYKKHFYFDFIHPVFYGIFLASGLSLLIRRPQEGLTFGQKVLLCLPLAAGAMDLCENTVHVLIINRVVFVSKLSVGLGAVFANTKWALAGFSLACMGWLAIKRLFFRP